MDQRAFSLLRAMERSWWYRGRAHIVSILLSKEATSRGDVLDYGAGNGGMHDTLKKFGDVYGFEPDEGARIVARDRGYRDVFEHESRALERIYSRVILCDVLEHIEDDLGALGRIRNALQPGGRVIINVPAYQWLWGPHDVTHHHFRRYNRQGLIRVLSEAGFRVEYAGYWNATLFPAAALMRLIGKTGEGAFTLPQFLNNVLFAVIRIEANCLRFFPLPFGLSVVAVGVRQE